jgi:hypothetical protein
VTPSLKAARRGMAYPSLERNIVKRMNQRMQRISETGEETWIQEQMN